MPLLEGKGFYIWKIHNCEGGDPWAITRKAQEARLTHLLIKIADGPRAYNVDLAENLIEALSRFPVVFAPLCVNPTRRQC